MQKFFLENINLSLSMGDELKEKYHKSWYADHISVPHKSIHLPARRTTMWTFVLLSTSWEAWLDISGDAVLWGGKSSSLCVLNHDSQGEDGEEYPELHGDREERQSAYDLVAGASWVYIRSVRWAYSETGIPSLELSNFEINVHRYVQTIIKVVY